jgi:hypothetical protein
MLIKKNYKYVIVKNTSRETLVYEKLASMCLKSRGDFHVAIWWTSGWRQDTHRCPAHLLCGIIVTNLVKIQCFSAERLSWWLFNVWKQCLSARPIINRLSYNDLINLYINHGFFFLLSLLNFTISIRLILVKYISHRIICLVDTSITTLLRKVFFFFSTKVF